MTRPDEIRQRRSFNALVDAGVYDEGFEHPEKLRRFVARSLAQHVLPRVQDRLRVLDCGCGTGAWTAHLAGELEGAGRQCAYYGFDVSDRMVAVAQNSLAARGVEARLRCGDALDEASYFADEVPDGFGLVFAFDVIQQLPRPRQYEALLMMASRLAPGGVLLIFDHERESAHGRRMARRKFLTRYLRLPLVPRYYCNAAYPPLAKFAARLTGERDLAADVELAEDCPKRLLVARTA